MCNFQRASVTLDASVKIYGSRVDSVHTIAFQTLSGLSRTAQPTAPAAQGLTWVLELQCGYRHWKTAHLHTCNGAGTTELFALCRWRRRR